MPARTVTIVNKLGLHARAAAKLVSLASEFDSQVWVAREGREVDADSIMGVMMLAAAQGTEIEVRAEGPDAEEALERVEALVRGRFGEPE